MGLDPLVVKELPLPLHLLSLLLLPLPVLLLRMSDQLLMGLQLEKAKQQEISINMEKMQLVAKQGALLPLKLPSPILLKGKTPYVAILVVAWVDPTGPFRPRC